MPAGAKAAVFTTVASPHRAVCDACIVTVSMNDMVTVPRDRDVGVHGLDAGSGQHRLAQRPRDVVGTAASMKKLHDGAPPDCHTGPVSVCNGRKESPWSSAPRRAHSPWPSTRSPTGPGVSPPSRPRRSAPRRPGTPGTPGNAPGRARPRPVDRRTGASGPAPWPLRPPAAAPSCCSAGGSTPALPAPPGCRLPGTPTAPGCRPKSNEVSPCQVLWSVPPWRPRPASGGPS